jgi:predicted dehydrogenase
MSRISRRTFAAAAAGLATTALSADRVSGANDRVRLGFIGLGNRGDQVLDAFLTHSDAEVVAVCDIHQPYLDFASRKIGAGPQQFKDYRKLLEAKDLDAVVVATPDHWHALMTVDACRAGKDVYCEKPLSLYVAEGRAMLTAARDNKRVVQCGIQRMSSAMAAEAAAVIRSGGIGKVTVVRAFHVQNEWPKGIGRTPDEDPPKDFDWDAWTGPAALSKYNKNRTFYRFRWFYDYSGGQLTNFGVHYLSQIHRSLGVEAPKAVAAIGGKFADYDNREVPDTMEVLWHYPGDTLVTFSQFNASGAPPAARTPNEFAARTPVDRNVEKGWRTGAKAEIEAKKVAGKMLDADHARNFLDCVKSRKTPTCDMEYGHRCTTAALVAGIAHRTKSFLTWDAKAEAFVDNAAANKLLAPEYRKPYKFPG